MSLDIGRIHEYTRAGNIEKNACEQFWVLSVQLMCSKKGGDSAVIHCSRQIHPQVFL